MNNLDNIIKAIREETQKTAAEIKAAAETEKEKIISDAEKKCGEIKKESEKAIDGEIKSIIKRADSARRAERRIKLLEEKQKILSEITAEHFKKISELSGDEYETAVSVLIKKRLHAGNAVIYLPKEREHSEKFLKELDKAAKAAGCEYRISSERNVKDGFVAVYGNIEENCTFAAVFDDIKDEIYAESARILFGAEAEI